MLVYTSLEWHFFLFFYLLLIQFMDMVRIRTILIRRFLNSISIHHLFIAIAGMEFCASMMWTACSVLMAERYANDTKKFTAAIMMSLSLGSTTIGTLFAKVLGGALLSRFHWRWVCLLSASLTVFASGILCFFGGDNSRGFLTRLKGNKYGQRFSKEMPDVSLKSIWSSISNVLGNRMFYAISLAHFTAAIFKTSDKVIGTLLSSATLLPRKWIAYSYCSIESLKHINDVNLPKKWYLTF